jgi:hypothetical protein
MKALLISLLINTFLGNFAFADLADDPHFFLNGECFNYSNENIESHVKSMVGRVDFFNFGTWEFEGTIYVLKKKDDVANSKTKLVTFHFQLPLSKKDKYSKTKCPRNLPPFKKKLN